MDVVIDQWPRRGRASSYDTVTLVFAKAVHGVVPAVVGLPLDRARRRLRAAGLLVAAPLGFAANAVVVKQFPRGGVAAGRHMQVKLLLRAAPG